MVKTIVYRHRDGRIMKFSCAVCGKKGYCHKQDQCPTIAEGSGGAKVLTKAKGGAGSGRGNWASRARAPSGCTRRWLWFRRWSRGSFGWPRRRWHRL